jgi:hypothetical protein
MNDMTGIRDIDLFDNSVVQVREYSTDLNEKAEEIKSEFELLRSCLDSNDLRFYSDDFGKEIEQLDNVDVKIEHYHKTMTSVSEGYKSQEQSVASSTNLYLNSI